MNVSIQGIGALGGFGCGVTALEKALVHQPPIGQWVHFETIHGSVQVPGMLADPSPLANHVPKPALRRMNHNNRIALLAAFMALTDAGMLENHTRGRMGIIVGTGYGATCNDFDFQHLSRDGADFSGSPTRFSNSVHNAAAAYISIAIKENGPNHSISHLDMSFSAALVTAIQWLQEDRVDTVLVGGIDEFNKAVAYQWYCDHMRSQPPDQQLPLVDVPPLVGEGACFFVLSPAKDDAGPYGIIEGAALERKPHSLKSLPAAEAYILSANGSKRQSDGFTDGLPAQARVASYAHIYGMMPVGAAFDLAIAALNLQHDNLLASQTGEIHSRKSVSTASEPVSIPLRTICCVQLGVGDTVGWISLMRGVNPAPSRE